jgi:hypothetical protein
MNIDRASGVRAARTSPFIVCALLFVSGPGGALADDSHEGFDIRTLSSRADMVSGGEVLVQIEVPSLVRLSDVRVDLNGRDVTNAFRRGQVGRSMVGLLKGLAVGQNTLTVDSATRGEAVVGQNSIADVEPTKRPIGAADQAAIEHAQGHPETGTS